MSNYHSGIKPPGEQLINRTLPPEARAEARARAASLPVVELSSRGASDLLLLATGEFSYCRRCGSMARQKSCGHGPEERLSLSGTEVRRRLREGLPLPVEFTRPEVAAVLADAFQPSRQGAVHA
jgi:ATP sulfurylase